jgi:hypothetical protein
MNNPAIRSVLVPAPAGDNKPKGLDLYARFAFAGAMCCSITREYATLHQR